ncbi:MAG: periplasmic sensor signal transduction histidine kinase [Myxococcales bacterium]|nr:periplasmic sensor signal transduction histidine kinase [Myxococcales bacterium]
MTRRRALAVFAAAAALLLALNALVFSLYRSETRAVNATLDDRLTALGTTTARWLATTDRETGNGTNQRTLGSGPDALLATLVSENRLEDAFVLDDTLAVIAGVRTHPATPLNLLRIDQDRLFAALEGRRSVGDGYSIANAQVEAAYFPIDRGSKHLVLALEAGAEFHEAADGVRTTYVIAVALSILVALVFGFGLGLALRALERTRLAHGRAERLAAVGQMAAMVAHEVRNPLGILRGQVELARERLTSAPAREQERLSEMLVEIDRINRLTEEFLALARDLPLDLTVVDLGVIITAVAEDVRKATGATEHGCIEVIPPASPIAVHADGDKLRQALHNLVLNAVQVGGPRIHVRVDAARDGDRARVTVADDGPGIPAEIAATLFEPFVTSRPGGSGLGLAIARRVAERHGGSLVLESRSGVPGATFSIYLPLEGAHDR